MLAEAVMRLSRTRFENRTWHQFFLLILRQWLRNCSLQIHSRTQNTSKGSSQKKTTLADFCVKVKRCRCLCTYAPRHEEILEDFK
jgi:hypothetical protein